MNKNQRIGQSIKSSVVGGEAYFAYVPPPLPPLPALELGQLYPLLDRANAALGRLDSMSLILPNTALFLYMYVRKEAVLSSQIEGTQSSLSDLLLYENSEMPGVPLDDVSEVSCYVAAMNHGLKRLSENFPLSLRLICEMHEKLMSHSRGVHKQPGEFRKTQNWLGGSRPGNAKFVPPPVDFLISCLSDFEKFLHDETLKLPILVQVALAHVQFETIHPFLDGNGRLGRLLITLILCHAGLLREPLLYLSLYLKKNRQAYYDHFQSVRETGDWESWVEFFLKGVIETAGQATETARLILELFEIDRRNIENSDQSTKNALALHNYFQKSPLATTAKMKSDLGMNLPTILRSLERLQKIGVIQEITGKSRHRIYVYKKYLDLLNEGTEPL